jgi:colicin import membrane protein
MRNRSMAGHQSTQTISSQERSLPLVDREDKLSKWLFFSFLFHGALILALFVVPFLPARSRPSYPVYTVDLVGGEKIGRNNLGTELIPLSGPKAAPKKTAEEVPPPPAQETRQETKKEKPKPIEKEAPAEEKVAPKEATKKEPPKKEPAKDTNRDSKTDESALDRVRERLIQSAVDRAKSRTEGQNPSKGDVISSGQGEGEGAAALGPGGRGGGVVKGMEFIIYQNRMLSSIKDNWAWVGQKSNLKVVVHFSIKDSGEITGLKIVQSSGDQSYDESVLRAVKKSSPLPPPPESSRKDFADVELTFRPKDLGA